MFLKMFNKNASAATAAVKRMENKALMEATVAIAVLVMHCSGGAGDEERIKTEKVLANTPALADFGAQVTETYNRYDRLCTESGFMMAKVQLMREIADVKADQREKEDVFVTGLTIAAADGEVDEKEMSLLRQIGQALGLRPEDYLG